jgi:hypothetical protein
VISLIVLGVAVLAGLGFIVAGAYRLVVAFLAFEKHTHFMEERAIYAQVSATGARISEVTQEIENLPELWARARVAFFEIQRHRTRLQSAARGVSFAARMARAVWDGPKKP